MLKLNIKSVKDYSSGVFNNYSEYLFSRICDLRYIKQYRQFFLKRLEIINTNAQFNQRIISNFGSYEMNVFNSFFNPLKKEAHKFQKEIDFAANKCAKDTNFLYALDQLTKKYRSSLNNNIIVRLSYIYNGDLMAVEELIQNSHDLSKIKDIIFNKNIEALISLDLLNVSLFKEIIENSKDIGNLDKVIASSLIGQIQSVENKRKFLESALKNKEILPFHMKLLDRCRAKQFDEVNFYSFLNFLSAQNPGRFFSFDSMIQNKIQSIFLKLESHRNTLSELINNPVFKKLDAKVQFKILHGFQNETSKWSIIKILLADDKFYALSTESQEGVLNMQELVNWDIIKDKSLPELEAIASSFSLGCIEQTKNRLKFDTMLKTNNFEGLKDLINQDMREKFHEIMMKSLALKNELKQTYLNRNFTQPNNNRNDPYTLTESQMKLFLGDKFKERLDFPDDASWINFNLDLFIKNIWSRFNFSTFYVLLPVIFLHDLPEYNGFITFLISIALIAQMLKYCLGIELCFPVPFPFFIQKRYGILKNELLKILVQERDCVDKIAFYHGASGDRGALYEFYSQLRTEINMTATNNYNHISVLREFDDNFDKKLNVDNFKKDVEERWKKLPLLSKAQWYDEASYYASRAISTNPGLFNNTGDMGECTLHYWQYGRSINKVKHDIVLGSLIERLWGKDFNKDELKARIKAYSELINKIAKLTGGTLLQILIDKDSVDNIGLVTEAGGLPLMVQLEGENEKTDKPSKLLSLQKIDPNTYEKTLRSNWRNFKKRNHLSRNYYNFFSAQQARIIVDPKILADPEKVTIYKYDAAIPESDQSAKTIQKRKDLTQLRKQLKQMVREDVMRSMANGVQLEAGSIATQEGLLPIQRYFQYVMKGVLNDQVEFITDAEKELQKRKKFVTSAFEAFNSKDNLKFENALKELTEFEQSIDLVCPVKSKDNLEVSKNDEYICIADDLKVGELLMQKDHEITIFISILKGYPELKALLGAKSNQEVKLKELLKFLDSQKATLLLEGLEIGFKDQIYRFLRLTLFFKELHLPTSKIIPLVVRYMAKMGFSEKEVLLATNLLSCDIFEKYIFVNTASLQQSRAKTEEILNLNAQYSGFPLKTYFILQYLLQTCKAKSLNTDKYYKPVTLFNGLLLPESQPDLKEWFYELLQSKNKN